MFLGLLFAVVWGVGAGAALDQTVPAFHDKVEKYIVQADHNEPLPYEDKDNAHKR